MLTYIEQFLYLGKPLLPTSTKQQPPSRSRRPPSGQPKPSGGIVPLLIPSRSRPKNRSHRKLPKKSPKPKNHSQKLVRGSKKPHITFSRLFFPHLVKNSNRRSSSTNSISPQSSLFYSLFKNSAKNYDNSVKKYDNSAKNYDNFDEYDDLTDYSDDLYDSPSSHYYTTTINRFEPRKFQNVNKQLNRHGRKRRRRRKGAVGKRKSSGVEQFKNIISRQQPAVASSVRPWWSNSISKRTLEIVEENPEESANGISKTTTTKSMDEDNESSEYNYSSSSDSTRPWLSNLISKRILEIVEENPQESASISTITTMKSMDEDNESAEYNFSDSSDSMSQSMSGKEFSEEAEIQVASDSTMYDFHNFGLISRDKCTVCLKG